MLRIIVASKNKGKLEEIKYIFQNLPYEIVTMQDAGIEDDIPETGTTFEENALIKARHVQSVSGEIALADDSGLEVDYLNGAPGVYSARFAGVGASDAQKNTKLLETLSGVPLEKRTARFVCVIALVFPDGKELLSRGTFEGIIAERPVGENGFGYDPLLFVPEQGRTVAQMSDSEKNEVSHRGKALRKMLGQIQNRT
ncbi:MAG: XTP/dITP diphosphatase [Bacillota bacterium]